MNKKRHHLPIPFGWYCVGYRDDILTGEVKALRYFSQDIVLYRTEQGVACVSEAFCPHLGAHLGHGGKISGETITCPFHAWAFTPSGECGDIPYAKQMPAKVAAKRCLYQYPVKERNGIIWVWYHPDRIAPLFDVTEHQKIQDGSWEEGYRTFEWTVNTAVQETAENAADQAHFVYVHGSEGMPKAKVDYDEYQRAAHFSGNLPGQDPNGPDKFRIDMLTANSGPGHTWQDFSGLFESFMLGLITPVDQETIHMRFAFVVKKCDDEGVNFLVDAYVDEVVRQVEQDIPIWNHKTFRSDPIFCDGDGPIAQFRKWFRQFYAPSDLEYIFDEARQLGLPTLPV